MYWHQASNSSVGMLLAASVACFFWLVTESVHVEQKQPHFADKIAATRLCARGFATIKAERLRRQSSIDLEVDPAQSGLIGSLLTPVTTDTGSLVAKQTTINANFAAAFVDMLKEARVSRGDTVAMGMTGSFPALNVACLAAVETLGLKPLLILSAASSQWGANDPDFLYADMHTLLLAHNLTHVVPLAISRGGLRDTAEAMSQGGKAMLDRAIARSGFVPLVSAGHDDDVSARMALFAEAAGQHPIKAYINVGGGTLSVGTHWGKKAFLPGVNWSLPLGAPIVHSVMQSFLNEQVPVVHIVHIAELAQKYGLPLAPQVLPQIGEGGVFVRLGYSRGLALLGLVAVVAALGLASRPQI